jgi:hypothetical protein
MQKFGPIFMNLRDFYFEYSQQLIDIADLKLSE